MLSEYVPASERSPGAADHYWVPAPTTFATETELRNAVLNAVLNAVAPWFEVLQLEVPGTHWSGKRLRLDAVLRPRNSEAWFDDAPVFGVEFKKQQLLTKDVTRLCAQAVDYAQTAWDSYGRLSVFCCPPPTASVYAGVSPFFLTRLLGQFNVGEFGLSAYHGWSMRLSGHPVWSETSRYHAHGAEGYVPPAAGSLIPKTGSR